MPFRQIVRRESAVNNLSEFLVYAIMREESEFDPTAISHANAYGLMQLIVPTAVHIARGTGLVATPHSLLVPATNIALGSRELAKLLEQFKGQEPLAIAGYNAGPGRPQRWLREHPDYPLDLWVESIEFAETRNYVKRVLSSLAVYQWLYAADDRKETIAPLALTPFGQ